MATVLTGVSPHGQGSETTYTQLVADALGVPLDHIEVVHGNTDVVPYSMGTFGSRSLAVGGAAVQMSVRLENQGQSGPPKERVGGNRVRKVPAVAW